MECAPIVAAANVAYSPPAVRSRQLSRVFLVLDKSRLEVLGGMRLTSCHQRGRSLRWGVDAIAWLREPMVVPTADIAWRSTLVHLTPDAERRCRMSSSVSGDQLHHCIASSDCRWYCWPCDADTLALLQSGSQWLSLPSHVGFARAVGVVPEYTGRL